MWASNSSGVVSTSVPRLVSPAALTRQSMRPKDATTSPTAAPGGDRIGEVRRHEAGGRTALGELGDEPLAQLRAADR